MDIGSEAFLQPPYPPANEWKTFDKYAHRVRELYSADPTRTWVYSLKLIYVRLAALRARDGVDLFPNLRSIIYFFADVHLADETLLPSSLQFLTFFAWMFEPGHRKALTQLSTHTPFLERLTLRGVFHFIDTNPATPLHLRYLHEVDLTRASMSSCDFQYLCRLLCESPIKKLSIHLNEPLIDELHSAPPLFPYLRHLLFCGNPLIAHAFLGKLTSTSLLDFCIEHEDTIIQLCTYKALLDLLHRRFSSSLKALHLNFGRHQKDVHLYHFIAHTLMALRPLVEAGLKELRYSMPIIVSTLPEELQKALDPSSWPKTTAFLFSVHAERLSDQEMDRDLIFWPPF